jgi:hypothetical protein
MRTRRVRINSGLLQRLYVDEGLSAAEIAVMLGCAGNTILRRLHRAGVAVRPRGPVPDNRADRRTWSPALAYAVGLMATDGNLSGRRGSLSLVSKDATQVETLRRCLDLDAPIARVRSSSGLHHKVQWCDRGLYEWLLGVGLTPAKSRTIGPLAVPDAVFADFFRGCIDGDGSILVYVDRYHAVRNPQYVYERLYVSLVSASRRFLDWVQASVKRLAEVSGAVQHSGPSERSVWCLRYAKAESIRLLRWIYYAPDIPCLARKRDKAMKFLAPLGRTAARPVGRPRVGWLYTGPVEESPRI